MIRLGRLCRNAGGSLSSSGLITILFMDLVGATEFASDIVDAAADEHFGMDGKFGIVPRGRALLEAL
jgi:hypothetical protein